jgi:hypothetical protein
MTMCQVRVRALVVALIALFGARAQADGSAVPAPTDEQQVIATEDEWVKAEIHRDALWSVFSTIGSCSIPARARHETRRP